MNAFVSVIETWVPTYTALIPQRGMAHEVLSVHLTDQHGPYWPNGKIRAFLYLEWCT
jgi:hypothetical protein